MNDAFLQNIVEMVYAEVGNKTSKLSGWPDIPGRTDLEPPPSLGNFLGSRVTGLAKLSGGRLGETPAAKLQLILLLRRRWCGAGGAVAALSAFLPVFPTQPSPLSKKPARTKWTQRVSPKSSAWAAKLGCGARVGLPDVRPIPKPATSTIPGAAAEFRRPGRGFGETLCVHFVLAGFVDKGEGCVGKTGRNAESAAPRPPRAAPAPAGGARLLKFPRPGFSPNRPPERLSQPVTRLLKIRGRRRFEGQSRLGMSGSQKAVDVLFPTSALDHFDDVLQEWRRHSPRPGVRARDCRTWEWR